MMAQRESEETATGPDRLETSVVDHEAHTYDEENEVHLNAIVSDISHDFELQHSQNDVTFTYEGERSAFSQRSLCS